MVVIIVVVVECEKQRDASVNRQRLTRWRELTVQLVDRPIGRGLIGTVDEGVSAALHQDRGARQAVLLEELPEGALVAI